MVQQAIEIQFAALGGTGDQVVEPLPAENIAVKQHFLEAFPEGRIGVFHQSPGEIGVGGTQDFEIGIHAEGNALQGDQGANDQGVVGRHLEGEAIHHAGEVVGDGLEIHPAHAHLDGLAKNTFKGRHDRFEIHVFRQETQADEIFGELAKIAIHQVHHGLDQARARFPAHLTHHPEVQVSQAAIGQG